MVELEAQIARFPGVFREHVRRCAAISDKIGELAFTFPLLLHALATEYGPQEGRLAALELVELGRPLAEIAFAIGLPLCLRRLPPEACSDRFAWARCSPHLSRSLANHLPTSPSAVPTWLSAVLYAVRACDETFAGWVAKQQVLHEGTSLDPRNLLPLALFAWHSQQEHVPLRLLAFAPWTPRVSYRTAVFETKHWINRVKLFVYFADRPIADTWLDGGSAYGFEFVPLTTAEHVINERLAMRNCVDGYAEKLAFNRCRLFSVRCLGERIALIEIVPGQHDPCIPQIAQLKGPQNSEVSSEVRRAAGIWLRRQRHRRIPEQQPPSHEAASLKLQQMLAPYWGAMAERGTMDRAKPLVALNQVDDCLVQLAYAGGLSGWPFARRA